MPFEYISTQDAIHNSGMRMVVVSGVPSPWGEAAKGIFHIKGIEWQAVRLAYDDPAQTKWAGEQSGPVAIYNDEKPRSGWQDILELAERLVPSPCLLPESHRDAVLSFGNAIFGMKGLGWWRRTQQIHAGLTGQAGFPVQIAQFLAMKYQYTEELGVAATDEVVRLLEKLGAHLKEQKAAGSQYYIGSSITAADIYSACCMAIFAPLPQEHCAIHPKSRAMFEALDDKTRAALDPILLEHRDYIYDQYLELPLAL